MLLIELMPSFKDSDGMMLVDVHHKNEGGQTALDVLLERENIDKTEAVEVLKALMTTALRNDFESEYDIVKAL